MSAYETYPSRGFYRSTDRAVLGGVCAGIADQFGFNLKVLRLLAVIAFIFAMPMAVIAYLAVVLLVPARAGSHYEAPVRKEKVCRRERRRARKQARREAKREAETASSRAAEIVRDKCQSLDERIADLEKTITSSRYQLDQEFRNL